MSLQGHLKPTLQSFNGPVTALAIWCQKAFVGCGNEVSIYCLKNLHLETGKQVLHGASIHGFCIGDLCQAGSRLLCVYGGKQICIIEIKITEDSTTDLTIVSGIGNLPDWIWEARWVKHEESNGRVAIALGHNTVALWDWKANQIIKHQDSVEKCILYCAHFIGDSWTNLVLSAGTVFNQVVLWLVSHSDDNDQESSQCPSPVMHTLIGHKGVIFSIKYHAKHQRLCSVSDDRSIRMWQIEFPKGETTTPSADDWREMKSSLLLSLFGHSARVFDVVLLTHNFASVGEDATCCIWDYSGHIINKFKGHKGKSIWSVAAAETDHHILTGGGDGSVRLWKINTGHGNSPTHHVLDVSKHFSVEKGDFPRTVALLDFDKVLIMMNSGSLYCYSMSLHHYDCLLKDTRFTSYSVVSTCPDKVKVAVASIGGVLKILQLIPGKLQGAPYVEEPLFDSKILAIVWLSYDRLAVSGQNGTCHILRITEETNACDSVTLHSSHEFSLFLPQAKHRWISAACLLKTWSEPAAMSAVKLLACGDKDGTIYSYHIPRQTETNCDLIQPNQSFHKVHGKNGVTNVLFHDGLLYSVGRDGCCRHWDVEEGQLVLRHGSKVIKGFEWLDKVEMRNGDLLFYGFFSTQFVIWSQRYNQKMFYVDCGGGHRSWGCCHDNGVFRFAYLKVGVVTVVDSAQRTRHEILKPPLHGREIHDVKLLDMPIAHNLKPFFLTLTASEDTSINIGSFYNVDGFTHWNPLATLKGHLSSVRALALLPEKWKDTETHLPEKDCSKRKCGNSDLNDTPTGFILFTGGGRAEIRVWKVEVKNNANSNNICNNKDNNITNVQCVENSNLKTQSEGLRGDSFLNECKKTVNPIVCTQQEWSTHYLGESRHKRPYSKWKTSKLRLDPETRVMSLDATHLSDVGNVPDFCGRKIDSDARDDTSIALEHLYIVSAAGSDGLLRVFCYNDETRKLNPVIQSTFHHGCVLKVLHFHFKSDHNLFFAFSTSTNGKIAVWLMDYVVRRALGLENEIGDLQQYGMYNHCTDTETTTGEGESLPSTLADVTDGCTNFVMSDRRDGIDDAKARTDAKHTEDDDKKEDFHPLCSLSAHQSGINSIHALQVDERSFLLASGGDDNALTVQMIEVKGQEVNVKCLSTNRSAHSAQITGLHILSDSLLASGSIDQRICVWGLNVLGDEIKMELLSCSYIHLADVSCMDVCVYRNGVYICLGGQGLCLFSWDGDQSINKDKCNE